MLNLDAGEIYLGGSIFSGRCDRGRLRAIRNPFYGDFLDGVTDALAKTDFQVLVGSAGFGAQNQSRLADAMIDRAMDGIILVAQPMPYRSRAVGVRCAVKVVPFATTPPDRLVRGQRGCYARRAACQQPWRSDQRRLGRMP